MLLTAFDRRFMAAVGVAFVVVGMTLAGAYAARLPEAATSAPTAGAEGDASPVAVLAARAEAAPEAKLGDGLRTAMATSDDGDEVIVVVMAAQEVDLGGYATWSHAFTWPAGEHVIMAQVKVADLLKVAALEGVASVRSGDPAIRRPLPGAPDEDLVPDPSAVDAVAMRGRLADDTPWSETAALLAIKDKAGAGSGGGRQGLLQGAGAAPDGWFDVGKGHAAREAWELGYDGSGVTVAVLDSSTDFAHQDLQGTWATLPEGHPYAGWPQVYDPYSTYLYTLELQGAGQFSNIGAMGLISMSQESAVVEQTIDDQVVSTACFKPLILTANNEQLLGDQDCNYVMPVAPGATVRLGFHPDSTLAALGADPDKGLNAAWAGVLLTDANDDGVFDTVYVDVDNDHDFAEEKPASKEDPLSWRDVVGNDGIADLSGGLLYFLADGQLPVPGAYLWGIEDRVPAAGTLVGLTYDQLAHGTLCASNVVSQGRLGVPPGVNLEFRDLPGEGQPMPVNPGMAPGARLVAIGDVYRGPSVAFQSAWRYAIFGHDPDRDDDQIQITSNSYGWSGTDNDGWDSDSRFIDYYVRAFSPSTVFLFSTGNGGPGYGTLAPPAPATSIGVAASTQMGSTGWDSITETNQIAYGDITPFSNRGPGADGRNGPEVAADGAFAGGAVPINPVTTNRNAPEDEQNGAFANQTWGGTSRSSPVAAGHMALVYQAFRDKNGRWPTWEEARSIMMSGARYAGYDTFTMGAGVVDGADAVRIAAGIHGIYAEPAEWSPGDYRGERYEAFAKMLNPGASDSVTISLVNPSDQDVEVTLSGQSLRRVGSYDDVITTRRAGESEYNFLAPDYFKEIDESKIPPGTDLMVVRGRYPMDLFDTDGDNQMENNFRLGVFRHTDWDDDGKLWHDGDGNGVVNHVSVPKDSGITQGLDRNRGLLWDQGELDRYEYMRFSYDGGAKNVWAVSVQHPLERWGAGIYIGLWHREICNSQGTCTGRPEDVPETEIQFQVDFYRYEAWDWLDLEDNVVSVPAGGRIDVGATINVPADAAYGLFQGAIFADYDRLPGDKPASGAGWEPDWLRTVIPVTANVAAQYKWGEAVTFGGVAAEDPDAPYSNGSTGGFNDWAWRPEAGDWRFFFLDAEKPPAGAQWVVRTEWDDAAERQSDLDTLLYGPRSDRFSDPDDAANAGEDWSDPSFYGPYGLALKAGSPNRYLGGGRWAFDTSSGGNEDWVAGDGAEGLHEIMIHNVRFSGLDFRLPFTTTVSSARLVPNKMVLSPGTCAPVSLTTGVEMPGFTAQAFGMAVPQVFDDAVVRDDPPNDPSAASFKQDLDLTGGAASLDVVVRGGATDDLDLFVVLDADGDGNFTNSEVVASSTTPTANEEVHLSFPPAGQYQVWVQGWSVPDGTTTADITIDVLSGTDVTVEGAPDAVQPGQAVTLNVCLDASASDDPAGHGMVILGLEQSPSLFRLEVVVPASRLWLPRALYGATP